MRATTALAHMLLLIGGRRLTQPVTSCPEWLAPPPPPSTHLLALCLRALQEAAVPAYHLHGNITCYIQLLRLLPHKKRPPGMHMCSCSPQLMCTQLCCRSHLRHTR